MKRTREYKDYMSDAEIMDIYKTDKQAGSEKMVEKYTDYVYYLIKKHYPSYYKETDEMYQHGVIGILTALRTFDADRGTFTTHCTPFIKKEIGKHIRYMSSESSEYYASIHSSVEKAKTKIETEGGDVTVDNLTTETGLSKKIVKRELRVDHTKVSFESLENISTDMALTDGFVVDDILSVIPEDNGSIIKMRVIEGLPFSTIANHLGITVSKAKKDYNAGLDMLRKNMAE